MTCEAAPFQRVEERNRRLAAQKERKQRAADDKLLAALRERNVSLLSAENRPGAAWSLSQSVFLVHFILSGLIPTEEHVYYRVYDLLCIFCLVFWYLGCCPV